MSVIIEKDEQRTPIPKKTSPKPKKVRVFVSQKASEILEQVIESLNEKSPGLKLSKNTYLDWMILNGALGIGARMEKKLLNQLYSEEKFLASAIAEIQRRASKGEAYTYQDFVRDHRSKPQIKVSSTATKVGKESRQPKTDTQYPKNS